MGSRQQTRFNEMQSDYASAGRATAMYSTTSGLAPSAHLAMESPPALKWQHTPGGSTTASAGITGCYRVFR